MEQEKMQAVALMRYSAIAVASELRLHQAIGSPDALFRHCPTHYRPPGGLFLPGCFLS